MTDDKISEISLSEYAPKLIHDAALPECRSPIGALPAGETLTLAFTDSSGDVEDAELLLWGDDFEKTCEMALSGERWLCTLCVPEEPAALWYCFRLNLRGEEKWLCADGGGRFGTLSSSKGEGFRLTVYERGFDTPEWFRGRVMYQIFPDRFSRDETDTAISGVEEHLKCGREVHYHDNWLEHVEWQPNTAEGFYFPLDFFGGTLRGIREKLPYLNGLGVGVLYLNPIVEARSNHRYDAGDYLRVDPILGTQEEFEALCSEAEKYGIRIILDGVFSHTGADSLYFNRFSRYPTDGAYNVGERSPYYIWYDFRSYPDDYRCWWGFPELPEVEEENPEWENFVVTGRDSVVRTWLRRGSSGWRLDVADELPDETLAKIRASSKAEKPDAVILGEVWEDAVLQYSYGHRRKYALGGSLDTVMNYPFRNAVIDFLTFRSDSRALRELLLSQRLNYPLPMYYALMNLVGSHDTERIRTALATRLNAKTLTREQQAFFYVSETQDARGAAMQALCAGIQFALPGVPDIYYGDEQGMSGMLDPFCRETFREGKRPLVKLYSELAGIRNGSDALKRGAVSFLAPNGDVLAVLRCVSDGLDVFGSPAEDGVFLCVFNRAPAVRDVVLDLWTDNAGFTARELSRFREKALTHGECLLSGRAVSVRDGIVRVSLPPESVSYFLLEA